MSTLNIKTFSSSDLGFYVISTIAYGEKDAILFDAQLLQGEAQKVVEIYAHPDVVTDAQKTAQYQVMAMKQLYKDLIPDSVLIPEPYTDSTYSLEGEDIQIIPNLTGDIAPSTAYFIPTIETMVAGDIIYNHVHPWTLDTDNQEREHWIASLQKLKSYKAKVVIGGHKDITQPDSPASIDFMIDYLIKFNEAIDTFATADEVIAHMQEQFPKATRLGMLRIGAKKNKGEEFSFKELFAE